MNFGTSLKSTQTSIQSSLYLWHFILQLPIFHISLSILVSTYISSNTVLKKHSANDVLLICLCLRGKVWVQLEICFLFYSTRPSCPSCVEQFSYPCHFENSHSIVLCDFFSLTTFGPWKTTSLWDVRGGFLLHKNIFL